MLVTRQGASKKKQEENSIVVFCHTVNNVVTGKVTLFLSANVILQKMVKQVHCEKNLNFNG